MSLKIGLVGASGRMGRELIGVASEFPAIQVCAAMVSKDSAVKGHASGIAGVSFTAWSADSLKDLNGVIDFSTPMMSTEVATACAEAGVPLLVGTTGHSPAERDLLKKAAERTPILLAPNTSVGVFALSELASHARRLLGEDFDIEISEIHHREKKDAPSGTARALADRLIAEGELTDAFLRSGKRIVGELGITSLRGGGVFGEHTVYFFGNGERIELTHRAESRSIFARGAYTLFLRLKDKGTGLYAVRDLFRQ